MVGIWKYEADFYLYSSVEPVFIGSIQGQCSALFDVTEQRPSKKQIAAWNEFCNLSPHDLREQFILGFINYGKRLDRLLKDPNLEFSSSYNPKLIKKLVRKTILTLLKSQLPLGKNESSAFHCDSLIIPRQEESKCHFVLVNFFLRRGKVPRQPYAYEMEALFCDGKLLFMGENSGLWTRLEWENEFNTSLFEPTVSHPPYW